MGLMSSIVSIGSVILQFSVNTFGAVIISAQTAARRIMTFALLPMTAISASMTTFASQNLELSDLTALFKVFESAVV